MNKSFGYILLALIAVSCSPSDDVFRLKGKFKNFNQGELTVFSQMGRASIDTVRLADGKFTYNLPLIQADTFVLSVLFPNYTEIPVIAAPGMSLKMEGDASHLREVTVTGNEENNVLTQFRLDVGGQTPPEAAKTAEKFINDHPESPACLYILNRYFLAKADADYDKADRLLALMVKAAPHRRQWARIRERVGQLRKGRQAKSLPAFTATTTTGSRVGKSDLSGEMNIISIWASWNYESLGIQRELHILKRKYGSRLQLLSISIDGNPEECRQTMKNDSINWPVVCDGKMWQTPAVSQLGFVSVPDNIVTDRSGKIIARGLSLVDLQKKIEEKLK